MLTTAGLLSKLRKGQNIFQLLTYINLFAYLWPQNVHVQDGDVFDFVIVGGGTAGCIIASNLAKLNISVLVIEAGPEPPFETQFPGLFLYHRASSVDWNLTSTHDNYTKRSQNDHISHMQQGRTLGGSSQVGYMIYGLGNPQDYDDWAKITKDSSWRLKELCPLIKRTEKLEDKYVLNSPNKTFHGTDGKVRIKKYHDKINDDYFKSYKELGYDVVYDINPNKTIGFTQTYFTIGKGGRQGTAYTFISPEKDNPKLHVMYNSLATKIIFDDNKNAVGVMILKKNRKYITVKVKKEVIVTAGVLKTPQLLMLSGVGPKKSLKNKGIKVVSDLPVGHNFQDHPTCILAYGMGKASKYVSPPNPYEFPASLTEGRVALNKTQKRADYQTLSAVIADPKFFLQVCSVVFTLRNYICDRIYKKFAGRQIYYVAHNLLYSESRGKILLNSTNPEDKPIIITNYYSVKNDLERHIKYVKHFNGILNTTFFKSVKAELADPGLDMCDGLKSGTDEYWECYIRGMSTTIHNYVGTCAMGSVVDSKLQVKGVKRLRVADASVMPTIVASSVQGTVMLIAQKASDLLASDYNH